MTKQAIVTLAIGARHAALFERFCRPNWTAYAERHGYDLFVIKSALDTSARAERRSPAWQKCLVLSVPELARFDRVVWADADICINPGAPSIVEGVPPERIGATDEHRFPTPAARQRILEAVIACAPADGDFGAGYWRAWRDAGLWHAAAGLPAGHRHIVQTGVLVLSPKHHRELLEQVYFTADDNIPNCEMRPLSHAIQARGLEFWIDPRFNALIWWMYLERALSAAHFGEEDLKAFVRESYSRSYFLHFAGATNLMPLLGTGENSA